MKEPISVSEPPAKSIGWGRGMFIAGAAAGVTPDRKRRSDINRRPLRAAKPQETETQK